MCWDILNKCWDGRAKLQEPERGMLSAFNEASLAELFKPQDEGVFEALDFGCDDFMWAKRLARKKHEGFSKFSTCSMVLYGITVLSWVVSNTCVSSPRLTSQMQGARRMSIGWVSPTKTHGQQGKGVGMTRPNKPWSPEGIIGYIMLWFYEICCCFLQDFGSAIWSMKKMQGLSIVLISIVGYAVLYCHIVFFLVEIYELRCLSMRSQLRFWPRCWVWNLDNFEDRVGVMKI